MKEHYFVIVDTVIICCKNVNSEKENDSFSGKGKMDFVSLYNPIDAFPLVQGAIPGYPHAFTIISDGDAIGNFVYLI